MTPDLVVDWSEPRRTQALDEHWVASTPQEVNLEIRVNPAAVVGLEPQLLLDMGPGTVSVDGVPVLTHGGVFPYNRRHRIALSPDAVADGVVEVQVVLEPTMQFAVRPVSWLNHMWVGDARDLDAVEAVSLNEEFQPGMVWANASWFLIGAVFFWLWTRRAEPLLWWFSVPSMLFSAALLLSSLHLSGLIPAFPGFGILVELLAAVGLAGVVAFVGRVVSPGATWLIWGVPAALALYRLLAALVPWIPSFGLPEVLAAIVLVVVAIQRRATEAAWLLVPLTALIVLQGGDSAAVVGLVDLEWRLVFGRLTPAISLLIAFSMVMMLVHRFARNQEAVERFIPREYLSAIGAEDLAGARPGTRVTRQMTVLFTDIRGFTTMSERLGPERTAEAVDAVLGAQAHAVQRAGGFVDKYIGDAVMALFESEGDALKAAHACVQAVAELDLDVGIGVGVNAGELRLGTVGTKERLSCTAIGDTVNLAARIEGLTRVFGNQILLTRHTAEAAGTPFRRMDRVAVKGRAQPVVVVDPGAAPDGWSQAFDDWLEGRFAPAAAGFAGIDDPAAQLWAERCRALAADPPADWDGITRMTTK